MRCEYWETLTTTTYRESPFKEWKETKRYCWSYWAQSVYYTDFSMSRVNKNYFIASSPSFLLPSCLPSILSLLSSACFKLCLCHMQPKYPQLNLLISLLFNLVSHLLYFLNLEQYLGNKYCWTINEIAQDTIKS